MPIGDDPELCPVGQWWDVIRVPEDVGRRAVQRLRVERETVGPVFLGDEGPGPRMYFLTPLGTAAVWTEPGTIALGA
ncbi:hypothetical protein ACWD6R_05455 [Streptomyces sp. NPDC005151]